MTMSHIIPETELIQGNCLEVLDKLYEERGEFVDLVFCDPPYFLSNGGIPWTLLRICLID